MQLSKRTLQILALLTILTLSSFLTAPKVSALPFSSKVAYIYDFGSGINDTCGPGCGSSIFVNAITGTTVPSDMYTTSGGHTMTFTNMLASTVNTTGLPAISGFDTVLLYEVCSIHSYSNLVTTLNTYLANGLGKVVIYDGDRCYSGLTPNYSTFLFPFTSSNPGPRGAEGNITFVESESSPATLTSGVTLGFVSSTDAVGDSNTFTSNAGGWCEAVGGTNALSTNGIQVGYARTPNGGLAVYNGQDNWFTFGPNALDKMLFDNILDQPFNPDHLPCGVPVTGIKLDPLTANNTVGTSHTLTATVTNSTGGPLPGVTVTFNVTSGPNVGTTGTGVTNSTGQATFTYTDTGGAGTDTIVATFHDLAGGLHTSNVAVKHWVSSLVIPEVPYGTLLTVLLPFAAFVVYTKRHSIIFR